MDLSTEDNCKLLIKESVRLMGGIDYLVLNHITNSRFGLWFDNSSGQISDKPYISEMFQVNTLSYIWTASAAMQELVKSNGHIAVVSSLAGHVGTPYTAVYSATKHALHGFFDSLRNELRILGNNSVSITVCSIGATDTEGAQAVRDRMPHVAFESPRDAAVSIVKGTVLRKREVFHPHHKVYPVVFLNAFVPGLVDYILRAFM